MAALTRGEVAQRLYLAALREQSFASTGVPDTDHNWGLYARLVREIAEIEAAGLIPDIPS